MGIHFFFLITQLPWPPRHPPHQLYLGGCLSVGNASLGYFPILATHDTSLMYPLCTSGMCASILDRF